MTDFSMLEPGWRLAIAGLVFLAAVAELALLMYKFISVGRKRKCIPNAIFLVLMILLLSALTMSAMPSSAAYPLSIPWLFFPIFAFVLIAHSFIGIFIEYVQNRDRLSSSSVKEALDNIDSGICFADDSGKIVLSNHTMNNLFSSIMGSNPQFKEELFDALQNKDGNVEKLEDYENLYCFPDGKIWRIISMPLSWPGLDGYSQISAYDVSEIHIANLELKINNEKLRQTNEQMKHLYEKLADGIREQETLNMRMRIHNDIGTSLIAISKMIESDSEEIGDSSPLKSLEDAVSYFSNNNVSISETWDDVLLQAKEMNVDLMLKGNLPEGKTNRKVVTAATSEVLTNCVKHAKGNRVIVNIEDRDGYKSVMITNNGNKPKEEIKEGGGLSALRRLVENSGGEMKVSHTPVFMLSLKLPNED